MTAPSTPASPAQAAATVSGAEVEAFCLAFYGDCGGAPLLPGTLDRIRAGIAAARERAPVQGAEAQPVAPEPGSVQAVVATATRQAEQENWFLRETLKRRPAPPDAPRPDIEAARREELLEAVAQAATKMPRATPGPGGSSTLHTFEIEAGVVWMLDKALRALGDRP